MKMKPKHLRRHLYRLIDAVWRENLRLKESGLVIFTWGNVSAIDRDHGVVVIKPSGVEYAAMTAADMVLTDLDGRPLMSACRPSSDLPSHLALYRAFPEIGAVVHTHSTYAAAFAQACRSVPCLGTTHADYFYGAIPVTDPMPLAWIRSEYEAHTGEIMVKKLRALRIRPSDCPGILVANHGPFAWGNTVGQAVENAVVLEEVCRMAWLTYALAPKTKPISRPLLDKHYLRKHGANAYYGQTRRKS